MWVVMVTSENAISTFFCPSLRYGPKMNSAGPSQNNSQKLWAMLVVDYILLHHYKGHRCTQYHLFLGCSCSQHGTLPRPAVLAPHECLPARIVMFFICLLRSFTNIPHQSPARMRTSLQGTWREVDLKQAVCTCRSAGNTDHTVHN